jgi:hypothetical protein
MFYKARRSIINYLQNPPLFPSECLPFSNSLPVLANIMQMAFHFLIGGRLSNDFPPFCQIFQTFSSSNLIFCVWRRRLFHGRQQQQPDCFRQQSTRP